MVVVVVEVVVDVVEVVDVAEMVDAVVGGVVVVGEVTVAVAVIVFGTAVVVGAVATREESVKLIATNTTEATTTKTATIKIANRLTVLPLRTRQPIQVY